MYQFEGSILFLKYAMFDKFKINSLVKYRILNELNAFGKDSIISAPII